MLILCKKKLEIKYIILLDDLYFCTKDSQLCTFKKVTNNANTLKKKKFLCKYFSLF